MDEGLRLALDELAAAEQDLVLGHEGPNAEPMPWDERDPDDRLYTAACEVANRWRNRDKEPKPAGPMQTGVRFTLQADGSTRMTPE
jgi:hypothetical protein